MRRRRPRPSYSRRPRPPRIPPPSLHPGERVRGSAILEEDPSADWGLVLWESYRNVGDWAATPRDRRACELFGAEAARRRTEQLDALAGRDRAVARALETIRDLLADPAGADPRAVALACRRVAAWAGANGRPSTQFYFAAAAGLCVPDDARQAYEAGRLARDLARWDTAEAWLEYAIAAARRKRDRETQAMAVIGLGNLFYRRGLYGRARDTHLAALTLARRHELREYTGAALHDLFVISNELRDAVAAEEYARQALAVYGASHPNIPGLAHDVAYFWLAEGKPARAFPVLRALLPHMVQRPDLRLRVLASAARAAATLGDHASFAELASEARDLGRIPAAQGALAGALVEMASGALLLQDAAVPSQLLDLALDVAISRDEVDVVARVTTLREQLSARPGADVPGRNSEPEADEFSVALVKSLESGRTDSPVPPVFT